MLRHPSALNDRAFFKAIANSFNKQSKRTQCTPASDSIKAPNDKQTTNRKEQNVLRLTNETLLICWPFLIAIADYFWLPTS